MEETTGTPAAATNGSTPPASPAPSPKPDFESRIRSDPDFALEQYNKMKSENTKLFQKSQQYSAITAVADQLGGAEPARQFIYEYDAIVKHPDVKRVVDHYRAKGVLPTTHESRPESQSYDELFPDPQAQEIQNLKAQLARVEQRVSLTQGSVGKQQAVGLFTQLKTEYPDGFDEFIRPALDEQFGNWEKTPQGRELLATLNYDHLKTIAGRAYMDHRDAIYERMHARKLDELKRGATGAPAGNLSTGHERVPSGAKPVSGIAAWEEFKRIDRGPP